MAGGRLDRDASSLEQRREDDLCHRPRDAIGRADPLERQLQVLGVLGHHVQQGARLAGDRVRRDDAGLALNRALDRLAGHLPVAVEVDERLRVPSERRRIDDRGVAEDHTVAFGFAETAYRGLETGTRDRVSHVLEQGRIRLVLTGTLTGDDEVGEHHKRHGDGVWAIALSVPDAAAAYEHAVAHGARGLQTPYELRDRGGMVRLASVATY